MEGGIRKERTVGITNSNTSMAIQDFCQKSIKNLHSADTDTTVGLSKQGNIITAEAMSFDEDEVEIKVKRYY